jgi:putative ABC transport system permease protein
MSVGLFALGAIANARILLAEGLAAGYAAVNPSSGTIRTLEPFDEEFLQTVRRMEGVADADGRAHVGMRFQLASRTGSGNERWRDIQIFGVPDYQAMRVNQIRPVAGVWPPPERGLLLERSSLALIGAQVGDRVVIETADHKQRVLPIAGVVHDVVQMPSQFDGMPRGYVAFDTLEWLGEPRALNELHVVAQNRHNHDQVLRVINRVKERVEKNGYTIPLSTAAEPGEVPLDDILQAVLLLLGALGLLSLCLSAFLIVNTVSALLAQQTRQIGVMKAIGARSSQIVVMYLVLALVYGLLALVVAVPLGALGARGLSNLMAGFFNFDLTHFYLAPQALGMQLAVGLLAPLLSALVPVLGVLRITPAAAMRSYGVGQDQVGRGLFARLLGPPPPQPSPYQGEGGLPSPYQGEGVGVRVWVGVWSAVGGQVARSGYRRSFVVSRPLLLSLRNTFRRQGRLALTLATLTLGGAMFIGVFSLRASLAGTLEQVTHTYRSDIWINFDAPQRLERVERAARQAPGVVEARGWLRLAARRVRPDGSESENLALYAPPLEAGLVRPPMLQGRWLCPGERGALVVSTGAVNQEPDIQVGDQVTLKLEGREANFRVVGVSMGLGLAPFVYAGYEDVARVTHAVGRAGSLMVVTEQHDPETLAGTAAALETHLKAAGLRVTSMQLVAEENAGAEMGFNMVIALALAMACLLAAVGGLGLMGTLSINVLERTREIGVMRAIGAADGAVAGVFIGEGVAIGLISWLGAALLALPLSGLLSYAVGVTLLQAPLSFTFSAAGVLVWLGVVLALSALASFIPARRAARLTVREVLAYE